ncbi:MAG: 50S ribosomal protein L34 [Oscillospiraceae bacterium]|nr:50S ribosomal protein L34 [Oscillospiraceae bacterium]
MDKQIKEAFDTFQTPERLKRKTKAALRRRTFDYGRNILQRRRARMRLASAALCLALFLTGGSLWFFPSASISVDINPSIELKVNALDRVISLEGRNSDGIALVKDIDVTGMTYDDAMQRILLSQGLEPYLEEGSTITITVAGGGSDAHAEKMLSRVLCRAYNIAEEENVLYCQVDWETVKAAQAVQLCIPRYLAWQNLLQTDPTITPEDVRQIPKETIRVLAQTIIIEDPCHE